MLDFSRQAEARSKTRGGEIVGHTEDGEGLNLRTQLADVKKVSGSVHKMTMGGNVVVLDRDRSYTQNKETNEETRISYEQGQCVVCVWAPVTEGEVAKETEKVLKGNRFATPATESEVHQDFTRRVLEPKVRTKTISKEISITREDQ